MLETATRVGKEDQVVKALEEDIIFGRLAPGTRLVEDALLARFPVTRHVVRQALNQLERMGVAVRERNKGATVRSLSLDEVRQIYEVRELVQRQAALTIPLPAPAALIDRLEQIQAEYSRHVEARYLRGIHESNDLFHLTLFGGCSNKYLVETDQALHVAQPARASENAGGPGPAAGFERAAPHDDRNAEGTRQLGIGAAVRRSPAAEQARLYRACEQHHARPMTGRSNDRTLRCW